jgi:polyhydroxyalkanoate synthesis regulator phasin
MMNTFKRALLAGVGAAVITKEKAEASLRDFVAQGRVNAADARALARQLARDGRREFAALRVQAEKQALSLAKQADALARERIAVLEKRLAALERRQAGPAARKTRRPKAKGA